MNASVTSLRIAKITVPMNPEAITAVRFGMISKKMMRHIGSPLARAASTKSRLRSESVCARSTRAPQAQPVRAITSAIVSPPAEGSSPAMMMISGSAGITRNTLEMSERTSSPRPPRKPEVTPTITEMIVARMPATRPTTITPCVPTMSWERMSWPVLVVPSQCAGEGGCNESGPTLLGL